MLALGAAAFASAREAPPSNPRNARGLRPAGRSMSPVTISKPPATGSILIARRAGSRRRAGGPDFAIEAHVIQGLDCAPRGRGVTPWTAQPPTPVGGPTGPHVIGLNGAGALRFTTERTARFWAFTTATLPAARRPTGSTFP